MRTVATLESINLYRHFFTFEGSSNTTHKDHLVDTLQLLNHFCIVNRQFLGDIDLHVGTPGLHMLEANLNLV